MADARKGTAARRPRGMVRAERGQRLKTMNVPPPVDEEQFRYILNRATGTLHKWPGCRVLEFAKRNTYGFAYGLKYMTDYDLVRHRLEREPTRRCRLCFGVPGR